MLCRPILLIFASLAASATAVAQPIGSRTLTPPGAAELATIIRSVLLKHLPTPLAAGSTDWGKQVPALLEPNEKRNHGAWRKYQIAALNPEKTLLVEVNNVRQPESSRTTFDLMVGFDAQIDFQQQIWRRGLKIYSGSSMARCKVWAAVHCQVTAKVEPAKGWFPDLVVRVRVRSAELDYSGLDVVHVAGIGGDGAKLLGEALLETLKAIKPSLEKDLLDKASAALVKAGDSKEIRLSLNKLLSGSGTKK